MTENTRSTHDGASESLAPSELAAPETLRAPPAVCVLGATARELAPLRDATREDEHVTAIRWVETGAGKAPAASAATECILVFRPALVLHVGVAGVFRRAGLERGDVVAAAGEIFADEGARGSDGRFLDLAELGLSLGCDPRRRPIESYVPTARPSDAARQTIEAAARGRFRFAVGPGVTVSTCTGTEERAAELEARWSPVFETMEGAAAAFAAWRLGCPYLEVRGISNLVGPRERENWDIDGAAQNAAVVASALLRAWFADPGAVELASPGGPLEPPID